ncbi:MAG TPA: hypothetical protein VD906_12050 [Caulobacteraceae bacterium]|nr:hypothetical protein [Caulobacteraceae bacterium]
MSMQDQGDTAAQLKDDINSGRTGDKVAGFDAAAAPLGTDEEAAGTPVEPRVIAEARRQETAGRPDSATTNAATPELQPNGAPPRQSYAMPVLLGVIAAVALLTLLLALLG